jgi:hypothetical protein
MRMDADSDQEECGNDYGASDDEVWDLGDDRAYWRRRFFILCGGVVARGMRLVVSRCPSAVGARRGRYARVHGCAR